MLHTKRWFFGALLVFFPILSCAKSTSTVGPAGNALAALGLSLEDLSLIAGSVKPDNQEIVLIANALVEGGHLVPLPPIDACLQLAFEDLNFDGFDDHASAFFSNCLILNQQVLLNGIIEWTLITDGTFLQGQLIDSCATLVQAATLGVPDAGVRIQAALTHSPVGSVFISNLQADLNWIRFPSSQNSILKNSMTLSGLQVKSGKLVDLHVNYCLKIPMDDLGTASDGQIAVNLVDSITGQPMVTVDFQYAAEGFLNFEVFDSTGNPMGIHGVTNPDENATLLD